MQKVFILLSLILVAAFAKHECKHDDVEKSLFVIDSPEEADNVQEADPSNRRLPTYTYSPIRIYTDFTYLTSGSAVVREYIQNQVVASAVKYFQNVLSVISYTGTIQTAQSCGGLAAPASVQAGVSNADLVILVTAGYTSSSETYLAYAVPCALSSTNKRPIYGMINYNLNQIVTATNIDLEETLITTLHELTHVLGFSSSLYAYWINPTTQTVLGAASVTTTATVNGQSVTYITAGNLPSQLQAYFGCTSLPGAPLENQGDSGSAGSHFERQIFFNELMTASAIADAVVSQWTLYLLQATGWYTVAIGTASNYERFTWGQSKGCGFTTTQTCMTGTNPAFTPEFCGPLQAQGCTFTGRNIGVCGTTSASTAYSGIPSSYNYWGNNTAVLDSFANNCPYFLGYPNLDCMQPSDASNALLTEEKYGLTSRCFSGTLSDTNSPNSRTGFCFPMTCSGSAGAYTLTVTVGSNTIQCTSAGTISVNGLSGTMDCPDPNAYCAKANPIYCKRGCSGRGTCSGTTNQCVCPTGWGGMDCGLRYYVDGCSRCIGNSAGTSCFGDGCSCNPATNNACPGPTLIGQGDGSSTRTASSNTTNSTKSATHLVLGFSSLAILAASVLLN